MAPIVASVWLALAVCAGAGDSPAGEGIVAIGDRRELFVDRLVVDRLDGAAQLRLHHPVAREVGLAFDRPWEGRYSGYSTVMRVDGGYRLYYRGMPEPHHDFDTEVTCLAVSDDGIRWERPRIGAFEVRGTRDNNVILARHRACHNFTPFVDTNPACPPAMRFKAVGGTGAPGLVALASADGIRWDDVGAEPIITEGAFDSQNVAFWSEAEARYVCYFRVFREGVRWIARSESPDFMQWSDPVVLQSDAGSDEHLYTNQLAPCPGAPHLLVGIPTRFLPGRQALTDEQTRALGTSTGFDFRHDCADIVLISTRGGGRLDRTFLEAFVRPGPDPRNWTSRANYAAWGIHGTGPGEWSFWVNHNLGYETAHLRRYTMRADGFVSVNAPLAGGELLTRVLRFSGNRLTINAATSAAGGVRVEVQDAGGSPLAGFALSDCLEILGDETDRVVRWAGGDDVGGLAGKPVRLRFVLRDADLFAFRFLRDG